MAIGFMAGSIISKMVMDTTKWKNSIKVVKKDEGTLKGMTARLAPKFKTLGRGMTIAGAASVAGLGAGIKAFKNFDLSMTESLAIMGDVSDEMKTAMADAALEMSGKSKFAAAELAEAYFFLASAGIDAAGAIKALPVVTAFAQAGAFGLARATDLLTDAQSALGLSSKDAIKNQEGMVRVSDVLVGANTLANASVSQFSEALTNRAGPSMRAYGVELESGVAVLAAFADQGIKGGEAGMQYAIVLRDLQKSAMGNKGAFEAAGIAVFDASGNLNNMGDIIGQLEVRLGGMSAEQKKAELATLGFQERSQAALLTLVGTSEKIKEYEINLRKAGGTTKEVSEKQLKSLSAQMTIAKNNITNAGIALGEQLAPALIDISKWVAKVVGNFVAWTKENPKLFSTLVKITAGLGGVLAVMGPIVMMAPKMMSAIIGIGKAFIFLAANPIVLIIAALATLVIGYLKVKKAQEEVRTSAENYAEVSGKFEQKLKGIATQAGLTMVQFHKLKEKYKGNIQVMALAIKKGEEGIELQEAMNKVGKERVEQQEKEKKANKAILPTIKDLIPPIKALKKETKAYIDFLDSMGIKTIKEKGDRTKELEGIVDDLTAAYEAGEVSLHDYKTALKKAKDEIEDLGTEIVNTAIPAANDLTDVLANAPAKMEEGLDEFPGAIAIKAKEGTKRIKSIWDEMADGLKTKWASTMGEILRGATSLKDGLKSTWDAIIVQFTDMLGAMVAKWATDFIQKIVSSATDTASKVTDAVSGAAEAVTSLGTGIGTLIVGLAKAIAKAAQILAAAAKEILIVAGVAIAIYTAFRLAKTMMDAFAGFVGGGGAGGNDIRLIKDNTWNINQNLLNLHNALMVQLDAIKIAGWDQLGNLNEIKLTSWNQTTELRRIRKILDTSPSTGGGNGGGGGGPGGTTVNINRIQNTVNINGIMISDRDYARERLIPEFLHALKQRSTKKRLQEILGIA